MKRVLITGMSGLIGGLLRRRLEEVGGYELSALNRQPVSGVECLQADIADLDAIKPAFEGIDVVVHLAANLDLESWEGQLSGNLIGTYNVYEAARLAGVKRVVFASSGSVIRGYDYSPPYDAIAGGRYEEAPECWPVITHDVVRPLQVYGAAKVWGEALGRHFADAHGLSVLCVRIGAVRSEDRPATVRELSVYLSHRDIADILHRCIDAPDSLLYDIFFATSRNKWGVRDLEHPKQVLGWTPRDSADVFSSEGMGVGQAEPGVTAPRSVPSSRAARSTPGRPKKVLITGMSGLIGGLLRSYLEKEGGYELSALNRRSVEGVECLQADIADLEAIKPAFVGKDVVVHLSAHIRPECWEPMLKSNIIGTYNVYEAARLAGVKRVVFASTGDTIRGWDLDPDAPYGAITSGRYEEAPETWPMITHEVVRPRGLYGASKVWGEALGRHFSDQYGLSVLCLRLGAVYPGDRPKRVRDYSTFLSQRDVLDITQRCIDAPDSLLYDIFFATSDNKWAYRDLEHPGRVLGWKPRDSAESYR